MTASLYCSLHNALFLSSFTSALQVQSADDQIIISLIQEYVGKPWYIKTNYMLRERHADNVIMYGIKRTLFEFT